MKDIIVCDICRYKADDSSSTSFIKVDKKEFLVHDICWHNAKLIIDEFNDYHDYLTTSGDY